MRSTTNTIRETPITVLNANNPRRSRYFCTRENPSYDCVIQTVSQRVTS